MSDKRETEKKPAPKPEGAPHEVDQAAQEKAGEERAETGGYE